MKDKQRISTGKDAGSQRAGEGTPEGINLSQNRGRERDGGRVREGMSKEGREVEGESRERSWEEIWKRQEVAKNREGQRNAIRRKSEAIPV